MRLKFEMRNSNLFPYLSSQLRNTPWWNRASSTSRLRDHTQTHHTW